MNNYQQDRFHEFLASPPNGVFTTRNIEDVQIAIRELLKERATMILQSAADSEKISVLQAELKAAKRVKPKPKSKPKAAQAA
jgi:hypothetical protein